MALQVIHAPLCQRFQLLGRSLQIQIDVVIVQARSTLGPRPIHTALTIEDSDGSLRRRKQRQRQQRSASTLSGTRDATDHDAGGLGIRQSSRFTGFGQTVGNVFSIPLGKVEALSSMGSSKGFFGSSFQK